MEQPEKEMTGRLTRGRQILVEFAKLDNITKLQPRMLSRRM
jgi:hypothetical protein